MPLESPFPLRGLKPPEADGGALFLPAPEEYGRALAANRALPRDALTDLAAEARRLAVTDARGFTASLGLDPGPERDPLGPVLASGHQPLFIHPGVAVKNFLLAGRARALGAAALYITVDSDEFTAAAAPLPAVRAAALMRVEHPFHEYQPGATYESAAVESADALRARLDSAARLMADERLAAPPAAIQMRRAWEAEAAPGGYMELPVSRLCAHRPFLSFAASIARDLPRFVETYNGALARYRTEHKLRYPANPFPDLARGDDGAWEAPFWLATPRGRERWYVAGDGARVITATGASYPLDDLARGAMPVRPRAITLSLYLRLFVCDLFIHGVGGAKYDQLTDEIIRRYYGLAPGGYALATGTRWIETARGDDPHQAIAQLAARKRSMEQHPENFADAAAAALAREKHELTVAIAAHGADKKSLGARIGELNALMARALEPARQAAESEITRQRAREPEWAAATARDYPYFLHSPERVAALLAPLECRP